jgi:hypothetical protein
VRAVADGWARLNWVAGGCQEFGVVDVRCHLVGLDVKGDVADDSETVDRIGREFDGKLVLELDQNGEQPQVAQAKILEVTAGEDPNIAQPHCVFDRRGDCLKNGGCPVRDHFEPSLQ